MGACDDWVEFDGNLSSTQVEKYFKEHQSNCASEDGNSYSGRLNMCNGLELEYKTFNSYSEAEQFISDKFQKWENAIGVRYLTSGKRKDDAQMSRLKYRQETLTKILNNLNKVITTEVETKLKSVEFIKCGHCKSRLDTRFRAIKLRCPVCDGSFASKAKANRRKSLEKQIEEIKNKITTKTKVLQEKADKNIKDRKVKWLIGGLCSS